jgi:hypothetical protein
MRDLDHPVSYRCKNTNNWRVRKEDLQCAFHLYILMVPSSALAITTDVECLSCGGFSLIQTICFGSLEFITDCFSSLSLSPRGDGSDATFMGSTRSGPPSPLWAMIGDSIKEFHTSLGRGGGPGHPSPRRHAVGAPPVPTTTTAWLEDTSTTQAMTMIPPLTTAPRPNTNLPIERQRAHQDEIQAQAHTWPPCVEQEATQWWNELAGGQATAAAWPH